MSFTVARLASEVVQVEFASVPPVAPSMF